MIKKFKLPASSSSLEDIKTGQIVGITPNTYATIRRICRRHNIDCYSMVVSMVPLKGSHKLKIRDNERHVMWVGFYRYKITLCTEGIMTFFDCVPKYLYIK